MPNLVNNFLLDELKNEFSDMGSCLVVSFDKLSVDQAQEVRNRFRENGLRLQVVKNRLALRALSDLDLDMTEAFEGKCGIVVAPEEKAISAAKLVRESMQQLKQPPLVVTVSPFAAALTEASCSWRRRFSGRITRK